MLNLEEWGSIGGIIKEIEKISRELEEKIPETGVFDCSNSEVREKKLSITQIENEKIKQEKKLRKRMIKFIISFEDLRMILEDKMFSQHKDKPDKEVLHIFR